MPRKEITPGEIDEWLLSLLPDGGWEPRKVLDALMDKRGVSRRMAYTYLERHKDAQERGDALVVKRFDLGEKTRWGRRQDPRLQEMQRVAEAQAGGGMKEQNLRFEDGTQIVIGVPTVAQVRPAEESCWYCEAPHHLELGLMRGKGPILGVCYRCQRVWVKDWWEGMELEAPASRLEVLAITKPWVLETAWQNILFAEREGESPRHDESLVEPPPDGTPAVGKLQESLDR